MSFIKNKFLWLGGVAVIIVVLLFGLAMMGSILSSAPKELPVAFVMLDEGGQLPDGSRMALGEMVQEKLLSNSELPFRWELVDSEQEAREGLSEQLFYGALVLPADLSRSVLSQMSPDPQAVNVTLLINEGMHPQAASVVQQILRQVLNGVNLEMSRQVLGMIGQQTPQIPVSMAESLLSLISVQEETLHPVGENHANGAAAGMLTQIIWLGALVTSVFLFLARKHSAIPDSSGWMTFSLQVLSGLLIVGAASGLLVWTASSWYGMEMSAAGEIWLLVWFIGSVFFLLQSSLLSWLGLPAVALFVLLLFFSMPVINLAPEFLPQATQDWLYSWTPFRFAVQSLRELMYFGTSVTSAVSILWWIAGISLALLFASGIKKTAVESTAKPV